MHSFEVGAMTHSDLDFKQSSLVPAAKRLDWAGVDLERPLRTLELGAWTQGRP